MNKINKNANEARIVETPNEPRINIAELSVEKIFKQYKNLVNPQAKATRNKKTQRL